MHDAFWKLNWGQTSKVQHMRSKTTLNLPHSSLDHAVDAVPSHTVAQLVMLNLCMHKRGKRDSFLLPLVAQVLNKNSEFCSFLTSCTQ